MSLLQRKQSRGRGAPRAGQFPAPRVALAGLAWDPGALCLAGQVPAPARVRVRGRLGLRESQRRERTVRCRVFIHPIPLGLL